MFSPYVAAVFQGPVSNLKVKKITDDTVVIAVTGRATQSGELYNPDTESKPSSSARLYDKLYARHWDRWNTRQRNSIWYGTLKLPSSASDGSKDRYIMSPPTLVNALRYTELESPIPTFGGTDHFDVCATGLIFVAKDPTLNTALTTKSDAYYLPILDFSSLSHTLPRPKVVNVPDLQGASTSPVFSPDGKQAVFLKMMNIEYESDKNRVILIPDLTDTSKSLELYASSDKKGAWDLSPGSVWWSNDGNSLLVEAEDCGCGKLFEMPSDPAMAKGLPKAITEKGYVTEIHPLSTDSSKIFISSTNLVDNSCFTIIDPATSESTLVSSNTRNGSSLGLLPSQVSEIWFPGAGDYHVHALVVKPSYFSKSKRYPLAYLIHGGPQGAWTDSWSTRWNPAIFAEQGYIVVTPNPTGSTGYGQKFVDGIQNEWGGRPYKDLVKGFEHIEAHMPYVDTSRAVALGASYGGYMMNWIQGQPLGRKFKALVTHDGVFSTLNQFSSEELYFPIHDFGGTLWENRSGYEKWDPAKYVKDWNTPHLIIHNELDYRLPISEGLAAFNCLQTKGVQSRFLSFPDENHWVLKPENSMVWYRVVLEWINQFTGLSSPN
jgi:dipeptidyl aminopeptidase/acylaminoacyl peptidase